MLELQHKDKEKKPAAPMKRVSSPRVSPRPPPPSAHAAGAFQRSPAPDSLPPPPARFFGRPAPSPKVRRQGPGSLAAKFLCRGSPAVRGAAEGEVKRDKFVDPPNTGSVILKGIGSVFSLNPRIGNMTKKCKKYCNY